MRFKKRTRAAPPMNRVLAEQNGLVRRKEAQLAGQPTGTAGTPSRPPGTRRSRSSASLLERLIDAEVRDLKAQRIDPHELVRHVVAQDEIDLRDVGLAGSARAASRACRTPSGTSRPPCTAASLSSLRLTFCTTTSTSSADGIRDERFERAALLVLGDRGVRQGGLEEEQRVGILALHGRPDPAEMLHDELRQEVAQLGRLRLVARGVVLHRLGPADLVDADDQRLDLRVLATQCGSSAPSSPRATSDTRTSAIFRYVFITSAEPYSSTNWRFALSSVLGLMSATTASHGPPPSSGRAARTTSSQSTQSRDQAEQDSDHRTPYQ